MLVALDWGTTALRAALMDAQGRVLERVSTPDGIMAANGRPWEAIYQGAVGAWLRPGVAALACGMIGSRQGWVEAPYLPCPAGPDALAGALAWAGGMAIVPGLADREQDVMRGEETQIAGALALLGVREGTFVLPGTHSKWAVVADGAVQSFRTFMTGEAFAALRGHTILGRLMPPDEPPFDAPAFDAAAFEAGCDRAQGALLHELFAVRTEGLFGHLDPSALPSFLSGLLVGEEVREALAAFGRGPVTLVSSQALAAPYGRALARQGVACRVVDGEVAFAGLHAVARQAGLA